MTNDPWRRPPPPATHPLHRWLCGRGSLTREVQALHSNFAVRVLRNRRGRLTVDEAAALGLPRQVWGWVREVLLLSNGQPVIYARSVVSYRDLRGPWHMVAGFGARPLGAALFADPRTHRGRLRFQRLPPHHPWLQRIPTNLSGCRCWARRSRFWRQQAPLLVAECFLPTYFVPGVSQ